MLRKIYFLLSLLVISSLLFTSCEEDSLISTGDAEITSLSNVIGLPGTELTINGSNFGLKSTTSKVFVGSTEVTDITSWSDSKIVIKLPTTLTSSNTPSFIQVKADALSNKVDFYVGNPIPTAPTGLKATSINSTTVHITYTSSQDEGKSIFAGYELIVSEDGGAPLAPKTIAKNVNPIEVTGLVEGTIYTFELRAVYNAAAKNAVSVNAASLTWSPASRFDLTGNDTEIKVFGTDSKDFGSGLNLFSLENNGPTIFKISGSENWQLCLYTRNNTLEFGSAIAQTKYTYNAGAPKIAQIGTTEFLTDDLNSTFLGEALNSIAFTNKVVNLKDAKYADQNKGVVFIVRVDDGAGAYNYAKVLVVKKNGNFLQGTGDEVYVQCKISYQKVQGVPYARF